MRQDRDAVEFWDLTVAELLSQLQATPEGLSTEEAEKRLREYGPNTLVRESRFVGVLQFMRLFTNPLVIILFIAAVVSFVLGEHINALIIVVIILLSVILNFVQEYQKSFVPNDLYFPSQWHLDNRENPPADVDAPKAWD
ncbi:MAG: hypothetical protein K6U00_10830, partial [Armatimonadetes bacterium]|nr:hypothetical protein [Armatimonadota bacterium]